MHVFFVDLYHLRYSLTFEVATSTSVDLAHPAPSNEGTFPRSHTVMVTYLHPLEVGRKVTDRHPEILTPNRNHVAAIKLDSFVWWISQQNQGCKLSKNGCKFIISKFVFMFVAFSSCDSISILVYGSLPSSSSTHQNSPSWLVVMPSFFLVFVGIDCHSRDLWMRDVAKV